MTLHNIKSLSRNTPPFSRPPDGGSSKHVNIRILTLTLWQQLRCRRYPLSVCGVLSPLLCDSAGAVLSVHDCAFTVAVNKGLKGQFFHK